jgi:hypothetical protein
MKRVEPFRTYFTVPFSEQARRISSHFFITILAFFSLGVDSMIDVVLTTEQKAFQSAKPRQIFLPLSDKFSPPQNVAFNNFKFKNTNVNPTLFDQLAQQQQQQQTRDNRAQSNNGSKVTDLISGLY